MIVVADTTPINYLLLIREIHILPGLYKQVLIPAEVHRELLAPEAPLAVQEWAITVPAWCQVGSVQNTPEELSDSLDDGEREAILLALQHGIDTVLIDDFAGRLEAQRRNLRVTGTLGILELAAQKKLLDFREAIAKLDQTNFRLADSIRQSFLFRNA